MADYGNFFYNQHILEHFKMGSAEVHLVFDGPTIKKFNPKQFEQVRRYKIKTSQKQHQHHSFTIDSQIPQGWQEFLECLTCKRAIVETIGLYLLQMGHHLIHNQQWLIISGIFLMNLRG